MDNLKLNRKGISLLQVGLLVVSVSALLLVQTAAAQRPPKPFPGSKRGQEAIAALGDRLPNLASRYGKSAEKLEQIFRHDHDLWLDPAEKLLYLCSFGMAEAEALPEANESPIPTGPFPLNETFQLHSLVGAPKVIYLDFDGHATSGTYWNSNFNGGDPIVSEPYNFEGSSESFSDAELSRIQKIWARVAEDFAIYHIDVTTEDPGIEALRRSGTGDEYYGIRVVISPSSDWYGSAGGVAYVGSFDWNSDTPTFVFSNMLGNGNEKYVTDAVSHETGHTLGLSHDGKTDGTAYYRGHGDWAPIMGVGYYKPITQWSRGEYAGANNLENDLTVMLSNGASYRQDDHADWIESATWLSGETLVASGIIERTGDMDVFGFQTEAGSIFIAADPAELDPNLDILLQVLDENGNIVFESNPVNVLPASLSLNLEAGTYYILVDGVGTGDPDYGYTDYASLGQYFIYATLPTSQFPPAAPTDLSAAAMSSSQISLNWTDNSSNENGFSIERSADTADNWIAVASVADNITGFTDTGLSLEKTYFYRVSAYNGAGDSDYSNETAATTFGLSPEPPAGLNAASVSADSITLYWTDNSGNETGFSIERSPNGNVSWQEIAAVTADITDYTDFGLDSGTTYFYRVAAYNLNGTSDYSNIVSAATDEIPPQSPTGLNSAASSYTQIDLSWLDNSDNENGYKVERSADGYDPWSEIASLAADSVSFSDTTVVAGTTYYYRVYAYNQAGAGYSDTAMASTDEPPAFVDHTASQEAAVAGSVSGSFFDTQADDSAVETVTERTSGGKPSKRSSYMEHKWIFQVEAGGVMTFFANVWTDAGSQGDSLNFSYSTDDENYIPMFAVTADHDDGNYQVYPLPESHSGSLYIKVTDTVNTPGIYDKSTLYVDHMYIRSDHGGGQVDPPTAPSELQAAGITIDTIDLSWLDNADNEAGFFIDRSRDGASWTQTGTVGADVTFFSDNGLISNTQYFYRIYAFNGAGESGYAEAGATTLQADTVHLFSLTSTAAVNRNRWDAAVTIKVHDQNHAPVAAVMVEGNWDSDGPESCASDSAGQCTITNTRLKTSVSGTTFTVSNVSGSGYIYDPGSSEADSAITAYRP